MPDQWTVCDIIKGSQGAPIMSLTCVCAPISHFSYHFSFPERLKAQATLYIFFAFGFRGFELGTARRASENAGHPKDPRLETRKPRLGRMLAIAWPEITDDDDDDDDDDDGMMMMTTTWSC